MNLYSEVNRMRKDLLEEGEEGRANELQKVLDLIRTERDSKPQGSDDYPLTKLISLDITKELDELQQIASFMSDRSVATKILKVIDFYREAMKEIDDYGVFLDNAAKVYCHVTNGAISKPNTTAEAVIAVHDDETTEDFHEWMKDELEGSALLDSDEAFAVSAKMDGYERHEMSPQAQKALDSAVKKIEEVATLPKDAPEGDGIDPKLKEAYLG